MKKKTISDIFIYIVLSLWAITTIFPFFWVIINSFKENKDIISNSFSIPFGGSFTFDNYVNIFNNQNLNIFRGYANSLIISISVVIGTLVVSTFAAFAMARFNFFGKKFFYFLMVACMMFPIFSIIFPLLATITKLHLNNNYLGVILPQIAGNISFTTILLTGFMKELPIEVEESAYLDGASTLQVIGKVVVPMSRSSFATASIFVFLWSYNDLFLQMIVLKSPDMWPICSLLKQMNSQFGVNERGQLIAAVALICVPVLIVYFFLQKHIIKGLTAGAVKG